MRPSVALRTLLLSGSVCPAVVYLLGCAGPAPKAVVLSSGDSVALISIVPVSRSYGTGLMLRFHPFIPLADTTALRHVAIETWRMLRPRLDSSQCQWGILEATSELRRPLFGVSNVQNINYEIEKRHDGRWYFYGEMRPLDEQS